MKGSPWFPFYPRDFLSDPNVIRMSQREIGVYVLLLAVMWQEGGRLPNDGDYLRQVVHRKGGTPARLLDRVLLLFQVTPDGKFLIHKRLDEERNAQESKSLSRSEAGKKGAAIRWQGQDLPLAKNSSAQAQPQLTHPTLPRGGEGESLARKIAQIAGGRETCSDVAAECHEAVAASLTLAGWKCDLEWEVPDRGDGRKGRIDIRATRSGKVALIEIDNKQPRAKSLTKLQAQSADARVILLRTRDGFSELDDDVFSCGLMTPDPKPKRPPDDPVVQLHDALTKVGYRNTLSSTARFQRARELHEGTGLEAHHVQALYELALTKGDHPGGLLAKWLDDNLWRSVLDEQRVHQREAGHQRVEDGDEVVPDSPKKVSDVLKDVPLYGEEPDP